MGPIVQPDESRTYAQGQLRQPLQAGCTYRISCWVRVVQKREGASFPTTAAVATDNLGAYFTTTRFGATTIAQLFSLQPQALLLPAGQLVTDTLNYTLLSRTFVAQGGEQYFTLGNFQTNAATLVRRIAPNPAPPLTAAYAIDDVSVEAVPPASLPLDLGPDRWLGACAGAAPATLTASPGFQGYRWRTGQTTRSIQVSQPGRYVVTADFGCGLVQDSVEVRRYDPRLTPLLGPPPALCPGQSVTLTALAGFESYQWADGPTGPSRTLSQPGRYRLTARTADGCLVRDSVELRLAPPLIPTGFPADTLVCAQQAWRYTLPPAPAGTTYLWSTGISGETLYVAPGAAGPYTLTVRTSCQTATATVRVRTQDCAALLRVPNVVTPNGDGQNDQFRILAPGPRTLRLQVFSRWGQLVFESADYRGQWPTGPQTAPGLYHYLLLDETYGRRYRGWVEVIR